MKRRDPTCRGHRTETWRSAGSGDAPIFLAGFWERLYPQVRRELSRRYPKHAWPEKPVG